MYAAFLCWNWSCYTMLPCSLEHPCQDTGRNSLTLCSRCSLSLMHHTLISFVQFFLNPCNSPRQELLFIRNGGSKHLTISLWFSLFLSEEISVQSHLNLMSLLKIKFPVKNWIGKPSTWLWPNVTYKMQSVCVCHITPRAREFLLLGLEFLKYYNGHRDFSAKYLTLSHFKPGSEAIKEWIYRRDQQRTIISISSP